MTVGFPKQFKNSILLFTRSHISDNFAAVTFNIYRLLIVEFLPSLSDRFCLIVRLPEILRHFSCLSWGIFRLLSCTQPILSLLKFLRNYFPLSFHKTIKSFSRYLKSSGIRFSYSKVVLILVFSNEIRFF